MRPIDHFDTAADLYKTRVALVDPGGQRLTFTEVRSLSERIATVLRTTGDAAMLPRVAICSPNNALAVVCTIAAMRAGCVVVPIHSSSGTHAISGFLSRIQPQYVLFHSSVRDAIAAGQESAGDNVTFMCIDRDCAVGSSLQAAAHDVAPFVDDWGDRYGNPDRPVFVRQTSGTSGAPKMVMASVAAFDSTHMVHRAQLAGGGLEQVCLVAAPFSHAAGVHAFAMLTLGAQLVLAPEFDPVDVLRAIEEYRVTHIWLPATSLYLLAACQQVESADCSSLRSIVVGASHVSPARLREAVATFGGIVSVNYSQIEGGFVTWLDAKTVSDAIAGDHPERLASSGTTVCASRIAIMRDDGHLVECGTVGEIVLRGHAVKPFITRPYVEDRCEMDASGRYGWHHTGDLGYLDGDGYLYVVGRLKDNVIVGGFKVSCAEVEAAILEMPSIADCAVLAVPDEVRGEAVLAVVSPREGAIVTPFDVMTYCRARLAPSKRPTQVGVWPVLPKTAVGKLDKLRIRTEYIDRLVRQPNAGR